ncbi:MAG: multicopper oxidase domain-containing protein [Cytophagaceae bacterium]|nr:multicopper oxidase domain-containing protein [Gemmatimonadaceae bacterium]
MTYIQHVRRSARWVVLLGAALAPVQATAQAGTLPSIPAGLPTISINDNRQPAGRLEHKVLTLTLEARRGVWYPEGPQGIGLPVAAFAEPGQAPQNPGPLIRVPVGTEVHITLRNTLDKPLRVQGLGAQRGTGADSLVVPPGAEQHVCFTAESAGTFFYKGQTSKGSLLGRGGEDSQLHGAIIVDAPWTWRANERVFVMGWWYTIAPTSASGLGRATLVINGLSWPHTEPLAATQGDSLHWRVINLTELSHPMHLHGFYFGVTGVGNGRTFTSYAPDERRQAVTEVVQPGGTMAMSWSPNRAGNWIFHCHLAGHISHLVALGTERGVPAPHAHGAHASHQMAGLVLGIKVAAKGPQVAAPTTYRPMRLVIRSRPNVYGDKPGYAYVLGGSAEESDTASLPERSPTLVLDRNVPVAINVVNRSHEPAAVHWHGIELESFPDGVPGWSGSGNSVLPAIRPGDSLTVRFTPPRVGTFMYHSHFNEFEQIASGMVGAIVVKEPGEPLDATTDRVMLFSDDGPTTNVIRGPFAQARLNGHKGPYTIDVEAGRTHRLRLINIRTDYTMKVSLLDGAQPTTWRLVAKDGADLPEAQATMRPSQLVLAPGEIYDVEFTPTAPGDLRLEYLTVEPPVPGATAVVVTVRVW